MGNRTFTVVIPFFIGQMDQQENYQKMRFGMVRNLIRGITRPNYCHTLIHSERIDYDEI